MTDQELEKLLLKSKESMPKGKTSVEKALLETKKKAAEREENKPERKVWTPVLIIACSLALFSACFVGGLEVGKNTVSTKNNIQQSEVNSLSRIKDYFQEASKPIPIHSSVLKNIDESYLLVDIFYGYDDQNEPILVYCVEPMTFLTDTIRFYVDGTEAEVYCNGTVGTGSFIPGNKQIKLTLENSIGRDVISKDEFSLDLIIYDRYLKQNKE